MPSPASLAEPPFTLKPNRRGANCLLAAPHAGRLYPAWLAERLRVPAEHLMRLEDRYVDLLLHEAESRGFATLVAHTPRAVIDLNRSIEDFDFTMVRPDEAVRLQAIGLKRGGLIGRRVRGGLGLLPRRLPSCGELWREPFGADDIVRRVLSVHQPYHHAIEQRLEAMAMQHGEAVLLDIHSMPSLTPDRNGWTPDIVIGDLHGTSMAGHIVDRIIGIIENHGLSVIRNTPYAGGYVLRRHGKPRLGRHAIQVEIDRRLYLDARMAEPGPGLPRIAKMIAEMAETVACDSDFGTLAEAAE